MEAALAGEDCVVVTPTASGKTLCYNVPVLNAILQNEANRALYIFPTKALSSDQAAELYSLIEDMGAEVKAYTYDGDTPASARTAIRQAGHVVVTNPDMLHQGVLPHHAKWVKLFENLRYVVIDEIHAYRGVFGSNLANVIRRLKRVCAFYGSHPPSSAARPPSPTPANLAEAMIGRPVRLIDENGAPAGERHVVFYDPPVVNRQLGIRAGSIPETRNIAAGLLRAGVQSIVFARARLTVEVLVRYLKDMVRDPLGNAGRVRGYRGGYLPTQRREIERELRAGNILTVVSTNALELGIDIGQLDACVALRLSRYHCQHLAAGRARRAAGRQEPDDPRGLVQPPRPVHRQSPGLLLRQVARAGAHRPEQLYILLNHIKCAAYELPFEDGELFDGVHDTAELLDYLCDQAILRHVAGRYYWMAEEFPQAGINLRSASDQNFLIVNITDPQEAPRHRRDGSLHRADAAPSVRHIHARGRPVSGGTTGFRRQEGLRAPRQRRPTTPTPISPPSLKVLDEFDRVAHRLPDALARRGAGQFHRHAVQKDTLRHP